VRLATKVIMRTKILGLLVLALAGVSGLAGTATASIVENVDLTFASGATFGYTYTPSGITLFPGGLSETSAINVGGADPLVSGTATPVPLPSSVWLMLTGLIGVGAMARKRRAA
jgi:hypothetical protein